jgi:hypothetical protein
MHSKQYTVSNIFTHRFKSDNGVGVCVGVGVFSSSSVRCTMKCKCKTFSKTALYILLKTLILHCVTVPQLGEKHCENAASAWHHAFSCMYRGVHFLPCATPDSCSDYTQPNTHIHLSLLLATLSSCLCCKLSKITWVMLGVHDPHKE